MEENKTNRKYHEINEESARIANSLNSFSGYKENSATSEYRKYCDKAYALLDRIITEKPEMKEKASKMVAYYCSKLATYYNDYYRNEASCPSIMISGAGNFPVGKKEKQNKKREVLYNTWQYLENYLTKIKHILYYTQPIKSNEENAIKKLEEKIKNLEQEHKNQLYWNRYYKKNGTLKGCEGLSEAQIEKIEENPYFPPFFVGNNTANIRRYKKRLEKLKKEKEMGSKETDVYDTENNKLFKVVENTEIMRLQLLFEEKPSEEIRNILKQNGFRWSPKNSVWQRQLTENARYSLKRILEKLKKEM